MKKQTGFAMPSLLFAIILFSLIVYSYYFKSLELVYKTSYSEDISLNKVVLEAYDYIHNYQKSNYIKEIKNITIDNFNDTGMTLMFEIQQLCDENQCVIFTNNNEENLNYYVDFKINQSTITKYEEKYYFLGLK